jgi:hypothetical protein
MMAEKIDIIKGEGKMATKKLQAVAEKGADGTYGVYVGQAPHRF